MTRHLIDPPRHGMDTSLLARFIRIARRQGMHHSKEAVARRRPMRDLARAPAYSRIARGRAV
ncbi:hypothetical protein [Roseinatronobacter sp. NSM]|uniref:hypothetical protein n=1 Tax=Roseinatronobacter sp. NSM TaxID=3457785 RepID=UPI004036FCA0